MTHRARSRFFLSRSLAWRLPLRLSSARLAGLGLALLVPACGGAKPMTAKDASGVEVPISIEHEPCDLSRGRPVDVNGDGRPDIIHVEEEGREICRMVDLNFDGRPDSFVYFDGEGRVRRRESDFDRDGRIDEIATYSGGVLVRKDRDTNLDGKLDTWDLYELGKLLKRLRDTAGAGRVNQWWNFSTPGKTECVVIQTDRDGDGQPDADELIDTCADSHEGPAQAKAAAPVEGVPAPAEAPEPSENESKGEVNETGSTGDEK